MVDLRQHLKSSDYIFNIRSITGKVGGSVQYLEWGEIGSEKTSLRSQCLNCCQTYSCGVTESHDYKSKSLERTLGASNTFSWFECVCEGEQICEGLSWSTSCPILKRSDFS